VAPIACPCPSLPRPTVPGVDDSTRRTVLEISQWGQLAPIAAGCDRTKTFRLVLPCLARALAHLLPLGGVEGPLAACHRMKTMMDQRGRGSVRTSQDPRQGGPADAIVPCCGSLEQSLQSILQSPPASTGPPSLSLHGLVDPVFTSLPFSQR